MQIPLHFFFYKPLAPPKGGAPHTLGTTALTFPLQLIKHPIGTYTHNEPPLRNSVTSYALKEKLWSRIGNVPLKRNCNCWTHEPHHAQNEETNGNIELLQPCRVVAADALLEIGTAVILAVFSLDEPLLKTDTSSVPKCCYQSVYCCLTRYFLSGLLNASRTAADDFDEK
jgi:hypothetical protein